MHLVISTDCCCKMEEDTFYTWNSNKTLLSKIWAPYHNCRKASSVHSSLTCGSSKEQLCLLYDHKSEMNPNARQYWQQCLRNFLQLSTGYISTAILNAISKVWESDSSSHTVRIMHSGTESDTVRVSPGWTLRRVSVVEFYIVIHTSVTQKTVCIGH